MISMGLDRENEAPRPRIEVVYKAPAEPARPSAAADAKRSALADAPWVVSTYFAEGLPFSLVRQTTAELFTALGMRLADIGMTGLYGLAWNLKFLWSPLVDRYGTSRRWLVATEAALGAVVLALSFFARESGLVTFARGLVLVALLAATHDIAVDGYYLRILSKERQAAYSGARVAAYRAAMLAGKSGLVALGGYGALGARSWTLAFALAGGALLALALIHALTLPAEPPRPAREGTAAGFYREALRSFLKQPRVGATLAFILVYNAGDALMFAMSPPFLKSLGYATTSRGGLAALTTLALIAGSIAGGAIIARASLKRALFPIALGQSAAILLYVALATIRPSAPLLIAAVAIVEQLAAGVGSSAFVVFLMRRCAGEHKASHFALGSALMSVASTIAGATSGFLAERLGAGEHGYASFFMIAFAASLPGVALAAIVPKD